MASLTQSLPEALKTLRVQPLFVIRLEVPPLFVVGQTPDADRRIGVIQGGAFEGERLSGTVLSGNDWQAVRHDSCTKLDVRLLLRTTDGTLIGMSYQALRAGSAAILEKLDKGEPVDPTSYYFRMNPTFETQTGKYDWMNRIIAVGTGHRLAESPLYSIFEVL